MNRDKPFTDRTIKCQVSAIRLARMIIMRDIERLRVSHVRQIQELNIADLQTIHDELRSVELDLEEFRLFLEENR